MVKWGKQCLLKISYPLRPWNMTFFGNRVFAGIIRTRVKMRLYWVGMSPKYENVLKSDRKGYTETQRSDVIMRADTGVVCTQAKKYQGGPAASTTWGQSWQSWSLRTSRRNTYTHFDFRLLAS